MDDDRADRTLYVGNLEAGVTEDILYELFLQAGPLVAVKRMADKPFAFVEFKHDVSVPYAKNIMEGTRLFQKELRIQFRSGSIHQQQSQSKSGWQPQPSHGNYVRSNSYPNFQGQSPQYQQNMNLPPQGWFSEHQMQGNFQLHGNHPNQFFENNHQQFMDKQFHNRHHQNYDNDFRRSSPQYHRTESFNEYESNPRDHQSYNGGGNRSSQHGRSQNEQRNSSGKKRSHHMRHGNEPQEIIEKQMRRNAESGMRHSSGSRGHHQHHESRSGGHHYRR
ncbi:RNA-binding protein 7-like [Anneissia japonica]|uniref:RNA-binding protein 7-like n=1 Tax=Anneissia japonica TaxID=1529436 RepID=UPI0014259C25|nr:RNA-binding protein 7-like [Anneissia japonica]